MDIALDGHGMTLEIESTKQSIHTDCYNNKCSWRYFSFSHIYFHNREL
jgi:hypothetical protein